MCDVKMAACGSNAAYYEESTFRYSQQERHCAQKDWAIGANRIAHNRPYRGLLGPVQSVFFIVFDKLVIEIIKFVKDLPHFHSDISRNESPDYIVSIRPSNPCCYQLCDQDHVVDLENVFGGKPESISAHRDHVLQPTEKVRESLEHNCESPSAWACHLWSRETQGGEMQSNLQEGLGSQGITAKVVP